MQFLKQWLNRKSHQESTTPQTQPKIRIAILGTGKIGCDLLVKVQRSSTLECVMFAGRNLASEGMKFASSLNTPISDRGIEAILALDPPCEIVFDATSAAYHLDHAPRFRDHNIFAIDMTPSQLGECCVPAIGLQDIHDKYNVSMISCGGQSSIPIAHILANEIKNISRIDVKSIVSANSIGPGTIANIEEYYRNTKSGLKKYTHLENFTVDLIVDDINVETKMLTSIKAFTDFSDVEALITPLNTMLEKVQQYVPGYRLESKPVREADGIRVDISVTGLGDFLPTYAGNLDIINCAAIAVAEDYAKRCLVNASLSDWNPLTQPTTEQAAVA